MCLILVGRRVSLPAEVSPDLCVPLTPSPAALGWPPLPVFPGRHPRHSLVLFCHVCCFFIVRSFLVGRRVSLPAEVSRDYFLPLAPLAAVLGRQPWNTLLSRGAGSRSRRRSVQIYVSLSPRRRPRSAGRRCRSFPAVIRRRSVRSVPLVVPAGTAPAGVAGNERPDQRIQRPAFCPPNINPKTILSVRPPHR